MLTIDITYHTATRKMELTSPSQCREVIAGTRGDHNTTQINFTVDGSLNGYNMFCAFGSRDITDAREVRNIEYEVYMTDATHGWVVIPDEIFAGSTRDVVPVQLHMMHSTDDSQYYAFNQIMIRFLPSIPDPTVHVTPISGETQYVSKEAFLIEVSEREAADTALGNRIDAEASSRQSADAALSEAIAAETSARQSAVSGESSARASADTALGGRIDAEIAARQSAVSGEAASRASADTALGGRINDEASARVLADNALSGRIDGKQDILGYTPEDAGNKVSVIAPESSSSVKYPTDYAVQQFVNSSIPTNVSAFTNDAGYLTSQDISGLATKSELTQGLATKQNTLTAGAGIVIDGSTISATSELYWCTYGTTTLAQVLSAVSSNKVPVIKRNDGIYFATEIYDTAVYFSYDQGANHYLLSVTSSGWNAYSQIALENTSNKVSAIDQSSTHNQYPTAKCVYDLIGNIEATLDFIRGV